LPTPKEGPTKLASLFLPVLEEVDDEVLAADEADDRTLEQDEAADGVEINVALPPKSQASEVPCSVNY